MLRVAIPLALPSLATGAALAWGRALGEFGATLMFAGSFRGVTQTAPLAIFERFSTDFDAALALSAVLVARERSAAARDQAACRARRAAPCSRLRPSPRCGPFALDVALAVEQRVPCDRGALRARASRRS